MIKKLTLALALTSSIIYAQSGAELTQKHCASCHILTTPTPNMISTLTAPPMSAVLFHLKQEKQDKASATAFIQDYVINPSANKAICEAHKVKEFGVMPSLKGQVNEKDLTIIAAHIYESYPTQDFLHMIQAKKANGKLKKLKNSPFLINSEQLPHLTRLLKVNWDKESLALTPQQKKELLTIRKETVGSVQNIKAKVAELESTIIEMSVDDESLESIKAKVDQLATLKAEASMVQLQCISKTLKVLNEKQVEFLIPFWGM